MTLDEAKQAIEQLKAQGETEESMLATFYLMFKDDTITVDELGDLCQLIGYELTDEFKNMSPEDQKTKGYKEVEDEDVSEEEIEDAKEFEKGEETPDNSDNKEEEQEKAKKLFGF